MLAFFAPSVRTQEANLPYIFSTFAGKGGASASIDGTGSDARFKYPQGLTIDSVDNIFVADAEDHTIRKITPSGVVTTIAGKSGQSGFSDGTAADARFGGPARGLGSTRFEITGPTYVAAGKDGVLYVIDGDNLTVRKITLDGRVSTLAGRLQVIGGSNGPGDVATFRYPTGIAVDSSGYIYVADWGNLVVRVVSPAGNVGTLAGEIGFSGSTDQPSGGTTARFSNPLAVSTDASGRILIGDSQWSVRRITLSTIQPVITGGVLVAPPPLVETVASQARQKAITSITTTPDGRIYLVENNRGLIREISQTGAISAVAGLDGVDGYVDGFGPDVRFSEIGGIVVDRAGSLYISDTRNSVIRKATRGSYATFQTHPQGGTVNLGQSITLSASATGNPTPTFQWRKDGAPISGATNSSLTLSNVRTSDAGDYSVTAGNVFSTFTSNVAKVAVATLPAISVPPASQTVAAGQPLTLSVTASAATSFQWQKNGVPIAGATTSTFSIASAQTSDSGIYSVIATNALGATDPALATATVTVNAGRIINLSILTSLATPGDSFTMGYVVGGNGTNGGKPLLIRAAGPSLGALGVGGTLDDPKFELFAGTTKSGENDNWGGSSQLSAALSAVGAFAYVGPTSKDAAAQANITSRDNSVVVSSANNGAGLVIAEIYDATPNSSFVATTPRLINVSVRKHLGSGLTVGFVLGGPVSTKVLIRAIGPTLGDFGVPGTVADPQLVIFDSSSKKIGENDNWSGAPVLTSAFNSVGAFVLPATSKDAALIASLSPGGYSVQVSGVNNTTGVALVEVYEVP